MKKHESPDQPNRRQFIRQSACASLGVTGLVNALAQMKLASAALAAGDPLPDYKALVVLFLFGGNDSNNMLIPTAIHPARADYESGRGVLAMDPASLHLLNEPDQGTPLYGLHPNLSPMADLYNSGALSFCANVGTLAYPIASREEYQNGSVPLPPQLFSHSDQQGQWQSSVPDKPFSSGWGGRVADLLNDSHNNNGKVSMNVTLAGINSFQVGTSGDVVQYAVTPTGAISLSGYGTNYSSALEGDPQNPGQLTYKTNSQGRKLKAFEEIMNYSHEHLMEESYSEIIRRARSNEGVIGDALIEAAASGVDFDAHFMNAQSKLGDQMKMIAKLISGRNSIANQRQIFFCSIGGYDTHQDQLGGHAELMTELGGALAAFNSTINALGVNDKVLTISHSDFTRTLTPNGENLETAGSDHGWGGHQFMMGGPVVGGNVFGTFPSLAVGADDDAGNSGRGRWIPTTSVDQYSAVAAKWLGVGSSEMETIFPNLPRFDDPFTTGNLAYLDQV